MNVSEGEEEEGSGVRKAKVKIEGEHARPIFINHSSDLLPNADSFWTKIILKCLQTDPPAPLLSHLL